MKKSTLIGIISYAVIFVALLLVATFYDLQISVALGNADSLFGQFFRLWGESVGWLMIPIGGAILFCACDKKSKIGKILAGIWLIVVFVGWYLSVSYFLEEFTGDSYIEGKYGSPYNSLPLYNVTFALIFTGLHIWAVSKIKKETLAKLVIFALAMLIALAINQIITTVLKNVWTRQRFRNLDIGNGGTSSNGFTPWYKAGLGQNREAATYYVEDTAGMMQKDAYKSFPSGHTSTAAISLVLIMLPNKFEKLKKFKICFYIVPIVFTVLVAISRIVNRAHYLSDVLFGATIGFLSVLVAIVLLNSLDKKKNNNKFMMRASQLLGAQTECENIDVSEDTEETNTLRVETIKEETHEDTTIVK